MWQKLSGQAKVQTASEDSMKIAISQRVSTTEIVDLFGGDSGFRNFMAESMNKDRQRSSSAVSQTQRRARLHKSRKN